MTSPSSSSAGAHPLRPYYTPSDDNASFVASASRSSSLGDRQLPSVSSSRPNSLPPLPPSSNRYSSSSASVEEVGSEGGVFAQLNDASMALVYSAGLQYASTCLAMPFEVGKLLLQVQWVPRDDVWQAFGEIERENEVQELNANRKPSLRSIGRNEWAEEDDEIDTAAEARDLAHSPEPAEWETGEDSDHPQRPDFGGEGDELSDEEDAEAYFRDLSNTSSRPVDISKASSRRRRRKTDSFGYVLRKSIHDDGTRPEFVMPVVVRGGVWEMIKAVGRGKEGWLGLWKGSFTTFLIDVSTATIQPIITSILSLFAPSAMTTLPLPYAPHPYRSLTLLLASHLMTGILVSPLDLVRTRLIVQSTLPAHRKYSGPWDALSKILREEGGWKTTYLHPNLLIPALLDFTLRPLLSLSVPLMIEHKLRVDPVTNPVSYSLAEFCFSSASLLITLPIETVRRRLQLQARAAWGQKVYTVHGSRTKAAASRLQQKVAAATTKIDSVLTGYSGTLAQPILSKPLRTCVETRPQPYEGVVEAIWRILTEESSSSPVKKPSLSSRTSTTEEASTNMQDSGIIAKQGHSSLGGLYSLYRGLGFAVGANALVFVLTIVTGERASSASGWAEI